jgi:hypothetical protein
MTILCWSILFLDTYLEREGGPDNADASASFLSYPNFPYASDKIYYINILE